MKIASHTITIQEFESLFKEQYERLCAIANQYLQDLDAAEEVVQATFVKFWETREKLSIQKSFSAYLTTAVKNSCLNQLKHLKIKEEYKHYNKREIEHAENHMVNQNESNELVEKIQTSIDLLPEGRKKIFVLSRYEGLKYKEIAEKLNISVKTVENQMGSALKFLKAHLGEYVAGILILIFFNK